MLLLGYQYRSTYANPIIPSYAVEGELEQKLIIHLSDLLIFIIIGTKYIHSDIAV
jgi:hypothetical protein